MFTDMKKWTQIRLDVLREEVSKREIIRREGIHWETLQKILAHPQPPGYRMQEARSKPKIGPYQERIAQIIKEDKGYPKKQRHTAKRIYDRIKEMGLSGWIHPGEGGGARNKAYKSGSVHAVDSPTG